MAGSYPFASQLEINDVRYDYHGCALGSRNEYRDTNGLRGTRSHAIERNIPSVIRVDGNINFIPTALELTTLLPIMNGAAAAGTTYPLGETITPYAIVVDRVLKVHTYAANYLNTARFSGSQGDYLQLDTSWVGTTETEGSAGTFASTALDIVSRPWAFHEAVVTIAGSTFKVRDIEWTIDNHIDADRIFNSQTIATTAAMDRTIEVAFTLPYGDSGAVYTTHSAYTGVQVVATFTNGVYIMTVTFVKVAFIKVSPEVRGKNEIMLVARGQAFKSGATESVVTVLAIS